MRHRSRSLASRPGAMLGMALFLPCAGLPAAAAALPTTLDFEVLLGDKPIGTHRFDVDEQANGFLVVRSKASFELRLMGIAVYKYRHQATERWQSGCLLSMSATTRDGGKVLRVAGEMRDGRFQVEGQPQPAAECPSSYAYWDLERLRFAQQLVNPQTGKHDAIRLESRGQEQLVVRGESVQTNRHRLYAGGLVIDLWHTLSGDWVQLESTASQRRLLYRLL
jgi:hypothetical protein